MAEILKPNFNNGLWASGGAIVAPSNSKIATGWTAEVPPFQWENYSQNRQDQGIAHILQHGISVWDNLTEYQAGKSYVQGSDGLIYRAKLTHTNVNPVTDVSQTNWSSFSAGRLIGVQTFTSSGTYTPTPGMTTCIVEGVGGGGAGGGAPVTISGNVGFGAGGHAGAYGKGQFTTAQVGASQTITIGLGGVATTNAGGNGGQTSFGSLMLLPGGAGGPSAGNTAPPLSAGNGNVPAVASTGANMIRGAGAISSIGLAVSVSVGYSGAGANSPFGSGGGSVNNTAAGQQASGLGSGGSGGMALSANGTARLGGNGAPGFILILEFA